MAAVACNMNIIQNQLTRSLERILEDAHLSGELKLSGRKLKDFPKSGGKYNLSDTVFADLSKNRFCEVPDDVTTFHYLERLLLYHNTIRSIPESVAGLQSLVYLDLSRNQLSTLPREICLLPLEVLLVSNNRLVSLPDELGRMCKLNELDASCNAISHLPVRIGELGKLRILNLRSNALVYLPLEVVNLKLVALDISSNRITTLPVELRLMNSLVKLNIRHNPLSTPPANLYEKGMVHIFKYLETQHLKNGHTKQMSGPSYSRLSGVTGISPNNTLGPGGMMGHSPVSTLDVLKMKRSHVDSGYSTSDGFDKRWSQEIQGGTEDITVMYNSSHSSASSQGTLTPLGNNGETRSGSSTPSTISPGPNETSPPRELSDDRLANIQTYREYKEALRQQRQLDGHVVYRSKEHTPPTPQTPENMFSVTGTPNGTPEHHSSNSSPGTPLSSRNEQMNGTVIDHVYQNVPTYTNGYNNGSLHNGSSSSVKKPIQKVTPSRNLHNDINLDHVKRNSDSNDKNFINEKLNDVSKSPLKLVRNDVYIKPSSPVKLSSSSILSHNNVPVGTKNGTLTRNGTRSITWDNSVTDQLDKFSFTMKREFDRQKEETELIEQLRHIIESRLKMSLPQDLASALTDGVVLCHLANHVSPRSVGSIHVPSATVPKLTMARCRRNVDNFLEACRKIGVEETLLPSRDLIINCADHDNDEGSTETFRRLVVTCSALISEVGSPTIKTDLMMTLARNEQKDVDCVVEDAGKRHLKENFNYVVEKLENFAVNHGIEENCSILENNGDTPCDTLVNKQDNFEIKEDNCKIKDEPLENFVKGTFNLKDRFDKYNHKIVNQNENNFSEKRNSLKDKILYFETNNTGNNSINNLNKNNNINRDEIDGIGNCDLKDKNRNIKNEDSENNIPDNLNSVDTKDYDRKKLTLNLENNFQETGKVLEEQNNDRLITILCLSGFLFTVAILIMYPLPD